MRPFDHQRILLGVSGGIAAYKAAWLARLLTQAGAEVDVVLTRAATEFIAPLTFEALTGRPVHTSLVEPGRALEHIKLPRAAQLFVVAPATADFLARAAGGHADDLLSACLLANTAPVLLVPAMNDRMWLHPQVQHNIERVRAHGYHVLPPDTGALAAGEGSGPGRMPEPETILAHAARLLEAPGALTGKRVTVTAGPTREPIDAVRFMSNRSTGRMGIALANAAWRRGATVTLIAGPLELPVPAGIEVVHVETTHDMRVAVEAHVSTSDVLVMAAAPADFSVKEPATRKLKKTEAPDSIALVRTDDILKATRARRRPDAVIVGFALETGNALAEGHRKLAEKGLDLVVVNDATEPGAGFAVDTNRVTLIRVTGEVEELPLQSKQDVADIILDRVEAIQRGRAG